MRTAENDAEPVYLRSLEMSDLQACFKWHNDASLFVHLCNGFRHVSLEAETVWLKRRVEYSDREVNAAVCLSGSGTHIGNVYLRDIDWRSQNAALGLFIGEPDCRGKGCGSSALRQMIQHAFNDLGLHRVYLYALAANQPALRSYLRVGFTLEGTLRDHAFKQGRFHDVVVLGLRPEEFARANAQRKQSPENPPRT